MRRPPSAARAPVRDEPPTVRGWWPSRGVDPPARSRSPPRRALGRGERPHGRRVNALSAALHTEVAVALSQLPRTLTVDGSPWGRRSAPATTSGPPRGARCSARDQLGPARLGSRRAGGLARGGSHLLRPRSVRDRGRGPTTPSGRRHLCRSARGPSPRTAGTCLGCMRGRPSAAQLEAAIHGLTEVRRLVSDGGREAFDASEDRVRRTSPFLVDRCSPGAPAALARGQARAWRYPPVGWWRAWPWQVCPRSPFASRGGVGCSGDLQLGWRSSSWLPVPALWATSCTNRLGRIHPSASRACPTPRVRRGSSQMELRRKSAYRLPTSPGQTPRALPDRS